MAQLVAMMFWTLTWVGARKCIKWWGSRSPWVKGQCWGQIMAGSGHARTCPTFDMLKATQQVAALVWCRCQLRCTLAPPDEYSWTIRVQRQCGLVPNCGLMSNCFDHLLE